jgi:hypothetical protein
VQWQNIVVSMLYRTLKKQLDSPNFLHSGKRIVLLRDHPLMSRNGVPNWPPSWTWIRGQKQQHPKGEVGILKAVLPSKIKPEDRCFLLISYQGSEYLGCLLFDNRTFCKHIKGVLQFCCSRRIAEIGSIDVSYLL